MQGNQHEVLIPVPVSMAGVDLNLHCFLSFCNLEGKEAEPRGGIRSQSYFLCSLQLCKYCTKTQNRAAMVQGWGPKAPMQALLKQWVFSKEQSSQRGQVGFMTPGEISELLKLKPEFCPSIGDYQHVLMAAIRDNQSTHPPAGGGLVGEPVLAGADFWTSSHWCSYQSSHEWEKIQGVHEAMAGRAASPSKHMRMLFLLPTMIAAAHDAVVDD
eukprot:824802-Amphidinium_carterae.1